MKTKSLRCRINEKINGPLLHALNKICTDKTIPDNNSKIDLVNELLKSFNIDYYPLGPGTNRYAILIDGVVYKIALDRWGQRDNLNEFSMSRELQPYVIKVYEVNSSGLIMTCQYVTVISKDEYAQQRQAILAVLEDLSMSYLLGDVGYISKNFLNWGYTDEGELVILDFAYVYRIIGNELTCNSQGCTHPYLEYNEQYSELFCPECRTKYTFMDIRRRYNKNDEERFVLQTKELSYKTEETTLDVEIGDNEDVAIHEGSEVLDFKPKYDDEEYDYSQLTYGLIYNTNANDTSVLPEFETKCDTKSSYYSPRVDGNIFDWENIQRLKEEKTMSMFMQEMARIYEEAEKRKNGKSENPYAKYKVENTVDTPSNDEEEDEVTTPSTDNNGEEIDYYTLALNERLKNSANQNNDNNQKGGFVRADQQHVPNGDNRANFSSRSVIVPQDQQLKPQQGGYDNRQQNNNQQRYQNQGNQKPQYNNNNNNGQRPQNQGNQKPQYNNNNNQQRPQNQGGYDNRQQNTNNQQRPQQQQQRRELPKRDPNEVVKTNVPAPEVKQQEYTAPVKSYESQNHEMAHSAPEYENGDSQVYYGSGSPLSSKIDMSGVNIDTRTGLSIETEGGESVTRMQQEVADAVLGDYLNNQEEFSDNEETPSTGNVIGRDDSAVVNSDKEVGYSFEPVKKANVEETEETEFERTIREQQEKLRG